MTRQYRKIVAPADFDYRNPEHVRAVMKKLQDAGLGGGWKIEGFETKTRQILVSHSSTILAVTNEEEVDGRKRIELGGRFGPNDGHKAASVIEAMPAFAGYKLVEFRPHLDEAVLAPMSDDEVNARSKIATVIGVKPWDVQVKSRYGGGYVVQMPRDRYLPTKHDEKLQETVEDGIGQFGWYIDVDKATALMQIIPANPPTFPPMLPYPKSMSKPSGDRTAWQMQVPVGEVLPGPGEDPTPLFLDLDQSVGALIVGLAGSGKTGAVNALVYGLLSRDWEVMIGDVASKAVDFHWCKPWVRKHGFGVRSQQETAAVVSELYDLVDERSALLAKHGVQKWQELDPAVRPRPVAIVVDELQGLLAKEVEPKALPPEHPLRVEAVETNMAIDIFRMKLTKLLAQARFVGIRVIAASQQAQQNTGITIPMKQNLPNRLLCGVNPDQASRGHAFQNQAAVPSVPAHIRSDPDASRGVGMFEFQGITPGVFKGYYLDTDTYRSWLEADGVAKTTDQDVPSHIIAKHLGSDLDDVEGFGHGQHEPEAWETGPDGQRLTGFERANAARHAATVNAASEHVR